MCDPGPHQAPPASVRHAASPRRRGPPGVHDGAPLPDRRDRHGARVPGPGAWHAGDASAAHLPRNGLHRGRAAAFGLVGLLPHGVSTLDAQAQRIFAQYLPPGRPGQAPVPHLAAGPQRGAVLPAAQRARRRDAADRLHPHRSAAAIQGWSHSSAALAASSCPSTTPRTSSSAGNYGLGPRDVDLIVATDSEGILGIGDQGVGGIEISIGKLAVYTAAAGIHPRRVIPVVLDVGHGQPARCSTTRMYLGNRHARVRGQDYDEFIDAYVRTATEAVPPRDAALGGLRGRATRGASSTGTPTGVHLQRRHAGHGRGGAGRRAGRRSGSAGTRMRDQRVVVLGAGHGRVGHRRHAARRHGPRRARPAGGRPAVLVLDRGGCSPTTSDRCCDFQLPYARPPRGGAGRADGRSGWPRSRQSTPPCSSARPPSAGAFTEAIVREMAAACRAPRSSCRCRTRRPGRGAPADLLALDRRPGPGGDRQPVPPGRPRRGDPLHRAGEQRPGLPRTGTGCHGGPGPTDQPGHDPGLRGRRREPRRRRRDEGASLLPAVSDLRRVSATVGVAVATAAAAEGLGQGGAGPSGAAGACGHVAAVLPEDRGRLRRCLTGQPATRRGPCGTESPGYFFRFGR